MRENLFSIKTYNKRTSRQWNLADW